jgi:hypothetical protein
MDGGRASGKGDGRKKGGFWGVFRKVLDNVSFDINFGAGASASRGPSGNATDPKARMEPVRQDRKEAYDEMLYRTTDGEQGQAPAERVNRERRSVARSIDDRTSAMTTRAPIPDGGGEPLSNDVRRRMEPNLGADLSDVRIHRSGESAQAANCRTFTV